MTGLLKSVLQERAERTSPVQADLDAIISRGDRRVRRTRVTGAMAGIAGVALIATVVPFATGQWLDADSPVAPAPAGPAPFADRQVSYAVGPTIHHGDQRIDVGRDVRSYVQTDDGFVFATKSGEVFFNDGEQTSAVGRTSPGGLYLKADDSGSYVAWVEFPTEGAPRFVVYDTALRERVVETAEGNRPGMDSFRDTDAAYVFGVDGDFAYWRSGDGLVKHDITTGQSEILARDVSPFDVADIANGKIAHLTRRGGDEASTLRVSTDLENPAEPLPSGWNGYLSPSGDHIVVEDADEMAVYDTATRADVTPDTKGYAFVAGYDWLDDDTVLMLGLESPDESEPIDILRCDVPSGGCTVAVDEAATFPGFAIPVGESID